MLVGTLFVCVCFPWIGTVSADDGDEHEEPAVNENGTYADGTRRTSYVAAINPAPLVKLVPADAYLDEGDNLEYLFNQDSRPSESETLCQNADFLIKILNVILPLLAKNVSGNTKTALMLQILRELIKSSPETIQDDKVIYKINDLVRTLENHDLDLNNQVLRENNNQPTDLNADDSKISFKYEIPTFSNPQCTAELLLIIKVVQESILRLVNNPICKIKVQSAQLPVYDINSVLSNPSQYIILQSLLKKPSTESTPIVIYTTESTDVPEIDNIYHAAPQQNIPIIPFENLVEPSVNPSWPTDYESPDMFIDFSTDSPEYVDLFNEPGSSKLIINSKPNRPDIPIYWNSKEYVEPQLDISGIPGEGFLKLDELEYQNNIYLPYLKPTTDLPIDADIITEPPIPEELPHWPKKPLILDSHLIPMDIVTESNELEYIPVKQQLHYPHPINVYPEYDEVEIETTLTPPFLVDGGGSGIININQKIPSVKVIPTTLEPHYYVEDIYPEDVYIMGPKNIEPNNPYLYDASPTSIPVINGIPIFPPKPDNDVPNKDGELNEPNFQNPDVPEDLDDIENYYDINSKPSLIMVPKEKQTPIIPKEYYPIIPNHEPNIYIEEITKKPEKVITFPPFVFEDDEYPDLHEYSQNKIKRPWYPVYDKNTDKQSEYPLLPSIQSLDYELVVPETYKSPINIDRYPWQIYEDVYNVQSKYPKQTDIHNITWNSMQPQTNKYLWNPVYDDDQIVQLHYPLSPSIQEIEIITRPPTQEVIEVIVPEENDYYPNKKIPWSPVDENNKKLPQPSYPSLPNIPEFEEVVPKENSPRDIYYKIFEIQPEYSPQQIEITTWKPNQPEINNILVPIDNDLPNKPSQLPWYPIYDSDQNLQPRYPEEPNIPEDENSKWLPHLMEDRIKENKFPWYSIYDNDQVLQPRYQEQPDIKVIETVTRPTPQSEFEIILPKKYDLPINMEQFLWNPIYDNNYNILHPQYVQPSMQEMEIDTRPQIQTEYDIIYPNNKLPVDENNFPNNDKNQKPSYPEIPTSPEFEIIVPEKNNLPDNKLPNWWLQPNTVEYDIITARPTQKDIEIVIPEDSINSPQEGIVHLINNYIQPVYPEINQQILVKNDYIPGDNIPVVTYETPVDQQILLIIKENIAIIENKFPDIDMNIVVNQYIQNLKKLINLHQITVQDYTTIINQYEKLIDYIKHLNISNEILKELLVAITNVDKSISQTGKSNVVELTYLVKRPAPVVYQPYYYVKYRLPYNSFLARVEQLLLDKPYLQKDPVRLYKELIALSNVVETSPDLKQYDRDDILNLTFSNGTLLAAKLVDDDDIDVYATLDMLRELNSEATLDDVLQLIKNAIQEKMSIHEKSDIALINNAKVNTKIEEKVIKTLPEKFTSRQVISDILKRVYNLRTDREATHSETSTDYVLNSQKSDVNQESNMETVDQVKSEEIDNDDISILSDIDDERILVRENVARESSISNPTLLENQRDPSSIGAKLLDATINAHNYNTFDEQSPLLDYDYSPLSPQNIPEKAFDYVFPNQDYYQKQKNYGSLYTGQQPLQLNPDVNWQSSVTTTKRLDSEINDVNGISSSNEYLGVQPQPDTLGGKLFEATIDVHKNVEPYQQTQYNMYQPMKTITYATYQHAPSSVAVQPLQYQYKIHHSSPVVYQQKYTYSLPDSLQYLNPEVRYTDFGSQVRTESY